MSNLLDDLNMANIQAIELRQAYDQGAALALTHDTEFLLSDSDYGKLVTQSELDALVAYILYGSAARAAEYLERAQQTIKNQLQSARQKFGVHSVAELSLILIDSQLAHVGLTLDQLLS